MASVKIVSGAGNDAPKPVNKAVIDGQGSIPYATLKEEKTPNTAKGVRVSGKSKGMGMARGGSFSCC